MKGSDHRDEGITIMQNALNEYHKCPVKGGNR